MASTDPWFSSPWEEHISIFHFSSSSKTDFPKSDSQFRASETVETDHSLTLAGSGSASSSRSGAGSRPCDRKGRLQHHRRDPCCRSAGYFIRADYPEMGPLVKFIEREIPARCWLGKVYKRSVARGARTAGDETGLRSSVSAAAECASLGNKLSGRN